MNENFKHIFQDKIIFWSTSSNFLLLIALVIYLIIIFGQLPPLLPIYNRMPWGYNRLGTKPELFIPLVLAVCFFGGNVFAIRRLYMKNVFVSRILAAVSFTVILCVTIYLFEITQLVL